MMNMLSHNIVSPLGFSSSENYQAVCAGKSDLTIYSSKFGLPGPFCASLMNDEKIEDYFSALPHTDTTIYTRFEKMAILSVQGAVAQTSIDLASPDVLFILSTTKGNVDLLEDLRGFEKERLYLWRSAQLISRFFNNPNEPLVVSNACISGCAAQIAAERFLYHPSGETIAEKSDGHRTYHYVVVVGAEVLSKFIISGFQSFKALSPERCKPFDAERCGLNLGEAAATIIYESNYTSNTSDPSDVISFHAGAICNDANHISGPSRTAEGQYRAIMQATKNLNLERLAFVNAHGTATLYNDDMESIALHRAALSHLPVNSLKSYFGHTLGAAGVLEVIISTLALQNHHIIKTLGCDVPGTAQKIHVADGKEDCSKKDAFLKMISGFGGGNAAIAITMRH